MISLRIKDTKVFMSQLLIKDTFDRMLLSEATIKTACSYTINGQINKEYYSDEEWDNLNNNEKSYSEWGNIKPFCFSLIKGNKVPAAMKLVMLASYELVTDIIAKNNIAVMPENVNGLFINMKYQEGYVDIFLCPMLEIYSDMKHSYIVELKYAKYKDPESRVEELRLEGITQANRYAETETVKNAVDATQLHKIVVVYKGMDMPVCEEI